MFNIFNFRFKKFDITSEPEYLDLRGQLLRLKNDVVSHQLLPKSVFDDAGNEFFLQIKTDEDMARISYKAHKGPIEFMVAYGHDIPNAIKNIYKMGILSYVSKSRLRNPESEYELNSVKAYIDSFREIDARKYSEMGKDPNNKLPNDVPAPSKKQIEDFEEFKKTAEWKDYVETIDKSIKEYLESDEYRKTRWREGIALEPSPKGPVSEDDLINKGRDSDLPGKGGTKFTLTLNAKDFKNGYDEIMKDAEAAKNSDGLFFSETINREEFNKLYHDLKNKHEQGKLYVPGLREQLKNMENQDEVKLTQEDLVKGLSEALKDKEAKLLVHPKDLENALKNKEKEFRKKYSNKLKNN